MTSAQPVERHLQRLENVSPSMAKADLKKLESHWRSQIGQAIDYAIAMANRTQKEVWVALGHEDGAMLGRWLTGAERPHLDKLFAIDWLRQPLVIALAGLAEAELTTQITFRRTA